MEYRKNIIPGVVLALFSLAYMAFATQIQTFKGSGATPLTARFMPFFWGVCLLILSVMLIVRGLKQKKALQAEDKKSKEKFELGKFVQEHFEVIGTFILLFVYIALMKSVGFLLMSILYLFFQVLLLTEKEKRRSKKTWIITAVTAIVIPFAIDYVFVVLLNVLLPLGIFGF